MQANLQVTPELKRHPIPPPLRGSLRCSPSRTAAELGLRPQTVLADFPRPGSATRRRKRGTSKTKTKFKNRTPCPGKARTDQNKNTTRNVRDFAFFEIPLLRRFVWAGQAGGVGEHCSSSAAACGLCKLSGRVAQPPSEWRGRRYPEGTAQWGGLLLGYLFLATQEKATSHRATPGKLCSSDTSRIGMPSFLEYHNTRHL